MYWCTFELHCVGAFVDDDLEAEVFEERDYLFGLKCTCMYCWEKMILNLLRFSRSITMYENYNPKQSKESQAERDKSCTRIVFILL